ncbi:tail fiber domain-containing protein [Chitinophaga qingshengii]|uniref:Tail fiber domain-containing protein n=1 Tax=Chitinophaga qingshengii TaxID=1569794 RepID=A0ABR7TGF0_9BACT|nr:tail fiber domain-containing protein [Chitinophaga qingshengii]MBC9929528.1 tail fiber domain-containing protein [Chitinophaga qingshengii]
MKFLFPFITIVLLTATTRAQQIYQIRADSVRIYNVCDTAELILENRTQGTLGFLFNKGGGRTEFRRLRLEKIGDSRIAISGQDTIDLRTLSGIGGIESISRQGDDIVYIKNGQSYSVYAPLPPFVFVPHKGATGVEGFANNQVVGFDAYDSPDMPPVAERLKTAPLEARQFYTGHTVLSNGRGYQMAVNWDGEERGVLGAFLRNKDDTRQTWGAWRELLFRDAADNGYIKNDTAKQIANFQIQGQGAIVNDYVFDNEAYHMGNLELRSANNPGIGFHRPNRFGWTLYSDDYLRLKGRGNHGEDVTFWHSGNAPRPLVQHNYRLHPDDGTSADYFAQGATFSYGASTPYIGPLLSFGGLNGGYDCQINADYGSSGLIAFRVRNGDRQAWDTWRRFIHDGEVATKGANMVLRTEANGYLGLDNWIRVAPVTGIYTAAGSHFYPRTPVIWSFRPEAGNAEMFLELQNSGGYSLGGFYADGTGNMGIVNALAQGYRLRTDAAGNAYVTGQVQATSFFQTSLRSLKKDIQPLPYAALPVLMKAQVRSFKFKADSTGKTNIGFIADEVPAEIATPGRSGVDQASTVGLLVKSAQELNEEQAVLKQQLKDLQQQLKDMQQQLKQQEQLIQQLLQKKS